MPDLTGTVHIVTGANSGLGYEAARALVRQGARTMLACRTLPRCQAAADKIAVEFPAMAAHIEVALCDLGSLASVQRFATDFAAKHTRLDGLMLNAGIMHTPYGLSEDGIELQFAVNHVGHQCLATLLVPLLQASRSDVLCAANICPLEIKPCWWRVLARLLRWLTPCG